MHNPWHKRPNRLLSGLALLFCLYLSLASPQVLAVTEGNMKCTGPGSPIGTPYTPQIGPLKPNENFKIVIESTCQVLRTFAYGASLGHTQYYHQGIAPKLNVMSLNGGTGFTVPEQDAGVPGVLCFPFSCTRLNVGEVFTNYFIILGQAGSTAGEYIATVMLNDTMLGSPGYGDYIQVTLIKYTVNQPSCSMDSTRTQNLSFGTLNSNDFATSQQIANITINCANATQVTASLSTGQTSTGTDGTSSTTLPQLLMVATWADTNTPVIFNTARTFGFTAGSNTISLGFRPKLISPKVTPSGTFSSQYTLNITYL